MVGVQTRLPPLDKVKPMNKFSSGDGMTGSIGIGSGYGRARNATEELARILGGIGALPESLPLSEHAEALSRAAVVEWQS